MEKNNKKVNLREYIYIDNATINSLLSQLNNGLFQSVSETHQKSNGQTKEASHSEEKSNGQRLGTKLLNLNHSLSNNTLSMSQEEEKSLQSKTTNIIFYDYAIKQLMEKLPLKNCNGGQIAEGSYVEISSKFNIYNFCEMNELLQLASIIPNFKESNGLENLKLVQGAADIMGDVNLITLKNNLVITKTDCFRISKAQLQLFKGSNRKMTIFGIVESHADTDKAKADLSNITTEVKLSLLEELNIIQNNANLIFPLAIYFK